MKNIKIHLFSQSEPFEYLDVENAYTKDGLYCVRIGGDLTHKFPFVNIFRIEEKNATESGLTEDVKVPVESSEGYFPPNTRKDSGIWTVAPDGPYTLRNEFYDDRTTDIGVGGVKVTPKLLDENAASPVEKRTCGCSEFHPGVHHVRPVTRTGASNPHGDGVAWYAL